MHKNSKVAIMVAATALGGNVALAEEGSQHQDGRSASFSFTCRDTPEINSLNDICLDLSFGFNSEAIVAVESKGAPSCPTNTEPCNTRGCLKAKDDDDKWFTIVKSKY